MTQVPVSPSSESQYIGMSDDEEIRRYMETHGHSVDGLGEVLIDYTEDLRDLGIEKI